MLGFFLREPRAVLQLLLQRWWYEWQLVFLSIRRARKLATLGDFLLYTSWLWGKFGWRRYQVISLEKGLVTIFIQLLWLLLVVYVVSTLDLAYYSNLVFNFFGEMELSKRGYFGYTVFVCCTLSWFFQLALWSCSSWCRELVRPYRARILTVNLVIFVILMSLGAQVARAKLGIRVWYPTNRVYGERIGAAYWD